MATRCCVTVTDKHRTKNYYRHWDGYPSSTGVDLFKFFYEHGDQAIKYGWDSIARELTHQYEETEEARDHSDIEYWYQIEITQEKKIVCSVKIRVEYEMTPMDQWKSEKLFEFGPHGLKSVMITD